MKEAVSKVIHLKGFLDPNLILFQLSRCQKWATSSCVDVFDGMNCEAAMSFCSAELVAPFFNTSAFYSSARERCLVA
jgi:hypothetical protein